MKKEPFALTPEQKLDLSNRIIAFFEDERDEELGLIGAREILNFFMDELAPLFYNRGVEDARRYIAQRAEDLYELMMDERKR